MRFSPAAGMARVISGFTGLGKKYGLEWWILVIGALIILAILVMALFANSIAPFSPHDQDTGLQLAPPGGDHLAGPAGAVVCGHLSFTQVVSRRRPAFARAAKSLSPDFIIPVF